MTHSTRAEPSQRQLRVGERFRHIIADTLRRGHFHEEVLLDAGHISVTEVRASPDLKNATAYIVVRGDHDAAAILKALNNEASVFQKAVNRESNLKFTPRIRFKRDEAYAYAQKIESILYDIDNSKSDE